MKYCRLIFTLIIAFIIIIQCDAKELDEIKYKDGNYYYYKNNEVQKGLFTYKGNKYFANEEGIIQVGIQNTEEGKLFFSRDKTKYGVMKTGKFQIGEDTYIFAPTLQTNIFEYEGNTYYANEEGIIQVGLQNTEKGQLFFSRDQTKYGVMRTGKFQIGGDTYIFSPTLQTNIFEYEGNTYYANEEGIIQVGLQNTEKGQLFFSRDQTKYGVMRTGKFQIGGDTYIFSPTLQTNIFEYEGNTYYANEEGIIQVGLQNTEKGQLFFSRDQTKYGVMRTGKFQIGGDTYIFSPTLQTNIFEYEGNTYYANEEGIIQVGLQNTEKGQLFFSRDQTKYGVMRTGKFQIGGDTYIFSPTLQVDMFEYKGEKYYADSEGRLKTGLQDTENGQMFFSRDKAKYGVMRTGTFSIGYNEYTFNSEGYFQKKQYIPYYYSQKDSRWSKKKYGKKTFGSTGCAPTAMAMAFTSILDRSILPTEVADFLYYYTDEYNRHSVGSSGMAIKYATDHYKVKREPIKTKNQMIEELKAGYIIFAVMGDGRFATSWYTHAILLYRYSNNYTQAMVADPLTQSNNYWVSIDRVFSEQSKDPDDSTAGSNFYTLKPY